MVSVTVRDIVGIFESLLDRLLIEKKMDRPSGLLQLRLLVDAYWDPPGDDSKHGRRLSASTSGRSGTKSGRRVAQVVEFMTEDLSATIEAGKEELKESGTQFQSALQALLVHIVLLHSPAQLRKEIGHVLQERGSDVTSKLRITVDPYYRAIQVQRQHLLLVKQADHWGGLRFGSILLVMLTGASAATAMPNTRKDTQAHLNIATETDLCMHA